MNTLGPNDKCSCGSGRKFKKCCDSVFKPHVPITDFEIDMELGRQRIHEFNEQLQIWLESIYQKIEVC